MYGSVNQQGGDDEEEKAGTAADTTAFKETDLLYYQGRKLSQKEKLSKIAKIAVPIIVAVLLIGSLAWFLLGDFGKLYPGGRDGPPASSTGVSSASSSKTIPASSEPLAPTTTAKSTSHYTAPAPVPSPVKEPVHSSSTSSSSGSSGGGSSCSANSKCKALGLTGECCPSSSGDMLDCCS
jgi:hypothetical protein